MTNNNRTYCPILKLTVNAAEDIPAFRFVDYTGKLCTGGNFPMGITETAWAKGDTMSVIALGTAIIEATGTIAPGTKITTSAAGKGAEANDGDTAYAIASGSISAAGYVTVKLFY